KNKKKESMARITIKDLPSPETLWRFPQKTGTISLRSRIHTFRENGHRIVSPKQTIQRIRARLRRHHVNFVARRVRSKSQNELDRHFFAHKITSGILRDNFGKDYTLGKGLTRDQSLVSGLCELIERFSALIQPADRFFQASVQDIEKAGKPALDPRAMGLPDSTQAVKKKLSVFHEGHPIKWTEGWHLTQEQPVLVPVAHSHLFAPGQGGSADRLVENRPNGLAAGNCLEEAIFQAILEIVERDAQAVFVWNQLPMPEIDPSTLPRKKDFTLHQALRAARASGLKVILKDITSDIKIPTVYAFGIDESEKGPAFQWGVGTHLDPVIAVSRALTELIQVRTVLMEFKKAIFRNIEEKYSPKWISEHEEAVRYMKLYFLDAWKSVRYITQSKQTISFEEIPDFSKPDLLAEIRYCLDQITAADTRLGLDVPVARVIIPGMEFIPWADYHVNDAGKRRLATVPPALGYRPSIDYIFGSGRESNFLL
ncbi:MAG: YcaO-like family protein, partial [Deltaproteobacteria bacterium]|nr:YcaO-like family protein [Deltaproteobacteria bacterium]